MHARKAVIGAVVFLLAGAAVLASGNSTPWWGQWGQDSAHTGMVKVAGQTGSNILADIIYDPFVSKEQSGPYAQDGLLVHYQTPLIDGNDVFMECKTGQYSNIKDWTVQTWCENKFTWINGQLTLQWTHINDWKPAPFSPDKDGPGWEPVYHGALTADAMWVPGFGGAAWKLDRGTGAVIAHVTPFGSTLDPNTYAVGPLSADKSGNIYYNVMQLDGSVKDPWLVDVPQSWLVKVTAAGVATAVSWASLLPSVDADGNPIPAANDQCTF